MDLKRMAAALQRGSVDMAKELLEKATLTKNRVQLTEVEAHIKRILDDIDQLSLDKNQLHTAEMSQMYGTLLQNYYTSRTQK